MNERPTPNAHDGRPVRNRILASLPPHEFARIAPLLEHTVLPIKTLLYDVDEPISHVHFMEAGVASIVGMMADGSAVETATVGPEGLVGMPIFHGVDRTTTQCFIQVPAESLRIESGLFRGVLDASPTLVATIHRYAVALFTLVAQNAACNRSHSMRERCARWLLHTHDRMRDDTFSLTHQFLSQMLGVRRATVTEALGVLQAEGSISYNKGIITVRDRRGLERAACECYAIIRVEFDRLLGAPEVAPSAPQSRLDRLVTSDHGMTTAGDGAPPNAVESSEH